MELKASTVELENSHHELVTKIQTYNEQIDAFFATIANLKSWEGDDATKFKELSSLDKVNYSNFGTELGIFADNLKTVIEDMKQAISVSKKY